MGRWTLEALAGDLREGKTTSRELVEQALARISDPAGEGARAFIRVDAEGARAAADFHDVLRRWNRQPSQFAGIPISVKDLFDLAGEVTTAGSKVLKDTAPAVTDAAAIAALKSAGFVVMGRTNMTEFAYSGVGLNPHYGTPRSSYDRNTGRIPGGSSAGAAVAVADQMCAVSIGTDTGGLAVSLRLTMASLAISRAREGSARRAPIRFRPGLTLLGPLEIRWPVALPWMR